jgi:hypothetical protein
MSAVAKNLIAETKIEKLFRVLVVQGSGFRVQSSGFRVQSSRSRVQGFSVVEFGVRLSGFGTITAGTKPSYRMSTLNSKP